MTNVFIHISPLVNFTSSIENSFPPDLSAGCLEPQVVNLQSLVI